MTNSERASLYNGYTGQEVKTATEIYLYIDVLFCINFIMDFLVLSIVGRGLKYRFSWWRMALSAVLGAMWAVFIAAFPSMPLYIEAPVTYVVISSLMVSLSFQLKKPVEILKTAGALCVAAAVMSGLINTLYQHTKAGYYIEQLLAGNSQGAIPFYRLLLLALGAWFGLRFLLSLVVTAVKERSHFYQVTMHYKGKEKRVTALLDTGNRLYEPVSKKPVHVVTYEAVRELCESVNGVVYIPFGSVGKSGVLPGIYLDDMEVRQGNKVKRIEKPLVAVCRKSLSPRGDYQMLLHEE